MNLKNYWFKCVFHLKNYWFISVFSRYKENLSLKLIMMYNNLVNYIFISRTESPWTARRSNQPILKEISPEYSLEGLMLKLKLQYFGHLMQRTDSLEKTLMLGN